jgi:hypothetical protein
MIVSFATLSAAKSVSTSVRTGTVTLSWLEGIDGVEGRI